jgi:hypothetical protein
MGVAIGCSSSKEAGTSVSGEDEELAANLSLEEQKFLAAARPFATAIASRKYADAYQQLSSHARARISVNQFIPAEEDREFERNEQSPLPDVDAATFAEWMAKVEAQYGAPAAVEELSVHTTDAAVLSRTSKEEFGAVDSMFAIGAMPDSVPTDIRRASIRGNILTELNPTQLAATAKAYGMTSAELQADEEFAPYFTLKIVLVEEGGALRVGYFEILPPSMFD